MILAIDPGNIASGIVMMNEHSFSVMLASKLMNEDIEMIVDADFAGFKYNVVIEQIQSYGMPVGREVFDTVQWCGRFIEIFTRKGSTVNFIPRKTVKLNLTQSPRAKDSNIIQALVDRFAPGKPNHGKGTKKEPGWFYGFSADIWQAYALGVTYIDMKRGRV